MASSSSLPTPTSPSRSWIYHVFLSFRGVDTRTTFVDHLYSALEKLPLNVYKDDINLPRGETIGPSLFKAIEESQIAVVVFSKNYADSSWCLDELSHIMKCKDKRGLIVMPIFYGVDPSDVRKRKRDFGKAFAKQEANNITKAESWRKALVDASNIAGWEPKYFADGHEAKLITEIVDTILKKLPYSSSDVDKDLVGMRDRVEELISQLKIGSSGDCSVRMVGIWGVGGGGKTTLATSVYKAISSKFNGHCFLENIRDKLNKKSLEELQQKMLSDVFKSTIQVPSVTGGKGMIKSLLCRSNVLVVLDDVNSLDQLDALAGSHDWFGSGSRIIITTRDEHLLLKHKVDHVSPVTLLLQNEAVSLFNKHAYNEKIRIEDYVMLSSRAVSYAAGLPLALKVVGSFLYDKNNDEWISYLDKLKSIPNVDVMDILMISYEGLEDNQKKLFLDIACFCRGASKEDEMEILDAFGYHPVIGIKVLQQKALISIVNGMFDMHDRIQEMGHHIVRGKDPNNPEKHSRVWKEDEIRNMCLQDATTMDNDKIEAIRCWKSSSRLFKILSTMKNLRWLSLSSSECFSDDDSDGTDDDEYFGPDFLTNELRCIQWDAYPAESLPDSFKATNLVVLILSESYQEHLWKNNKRRLPNLKVLQLRDMKELLNTPNFDHLPRLQTLLLFQCHKLKEIHPSLGNHRNLKDVKVQRCPKLRMFPAIEQMEELKTLTISHCPEMLEFPGFRGKMESSSLYKFPTEVLPSHQLLHNLQKLTLAYCNFKEGKFPDIGELSNLQSLDLSGNDFEQLPSSLSQLTQLKIIKLIYCRYLENLPQFPSSLAVFKAYGCDKLESIGRCITDCKRLSHVEIGIVTDGNRLLESMLQGKDIEYRCMYLELVGLEIPKKIKPPISNGNRCTLQLPENWFNEYCGFIMCALTDGSNFDNVKITMKQVTDSSMGMDYQDDAVWKESDDDTTSVVYVPFGSLRHASWWDVTYKQVSFEIYFQRFYRNGPECSACGVMLIPGKSENSLTEPSTDSSKFSDDNYTPKIDIKQDSKYALVYTISTPQFS